VGVPKKAVRALSFVFVQKQHAHETQHTTHRLGSAQLAAHARVLLLHARDGAARTLERRLGRRLAVL
jgi:hypothetical protein